MKILSVPVTNLITETAQRVLQLVHTNGEIFLTLHFEDRYPIIYFKQTSFVARCSKNLNDKLACGISIS